MKVAVPEQNQASDPHSPFPASRSPASSGSPTSSLCPWGLFLRAPCWGPKLGSGDHRPSCCCSQSSWAPAGGHWRAKGSLWEASSIPLSDCSVCKDGVALRKPQSNHCGELRAEERPPCESSSADWGPEAVLSQDA